MSAISLKSITGITSITAPAGVDNQLTLHNNNTAERVKIDVAGNVHINNQLTVAGISSFNADTFFMGATSGRDVQWDKSANYLRFKDNAFATFGNADDLFIYHDGNHSQIRDVGSGFLLLGGSQIHLMNGSGNETFLKCISNAGVHLYNNNVEVAYTNNQGLYVTNTGAEAVLRVLSPSGHHARIDMTADLGAAHNDNYRLEVNTDQKFRVYGKNYNGQYTSFIELDQAGQVTLTRDLDVARHLDVNGHTDLDNVSIAGVTTTAGTLNAANIVQVGTTNDTGELRIGHDGSSYRARLVSNSANRLTIDADGPERIQMHGGVIYMRPLNSEKSAAFVANGPAELYHNDIKTAFTDVDTWKVYGRTANSGMIEIASNQGANNNDRFRIHKTSAAERLTIQNYASGSWVENIRITGGGGVELKHSNGTTRFQTTGTGAQVTTASSANSVKNITTSTSTPSGGSDGDLWFTYVA